MMCQTLPKEPIAPGLARRMLDDLNDRVPRERLDDARLLVSEVVTNAVEHVDSPGEIKIQVILDDRRLRIEVADPGEGFHVRERDPDGHRGWGLQFVQRLSDRWGVACDDGTRVWFELTA